MTTEARFIPDPDFNPRRPATPTRPQQQSVKDLNAWLHATHGQAVDAFSDQGIRLGFQQNLPHQAIALHVSTDNASFSFALPASGPIQRLEQAEPMVAKAFERMPSMGQAFRAYDDAFEGRSKHQRGHVSVQNGPLEDREGWQLLSQEGAAPETWRTTTSTTASLEEGVMVWCREQSALRAATSKENLVLLLQDPAQAVHNPDAPPFPTSAGNASAFELPGLTTERHAYRVYLSGANDGLTGEALLNLHVYMRDAHRPNGAGHVVAVDSTMQMHASGVHFTQGRGDTLCHTLTPKEMGVDPMLAGLYIDTGAPMVNALPQHQTQVHESYDFTMALDDDNTLASGQDFTR